MTFWPQPLAGILYNGDFQHDPLRFHVPNQPWEKHEIMTETARRAISVEWHSFKPDQWGPRSLFYWTYSQSWVKTVLCFRKKWMNRENPVILSIRKDEFLQRRAHSCLKNRKTTNFQRCSKGVGKEGIWSKISSESGPSVAKQNYDFFLVTMVAVATHWHQDSGNSIHLEHIWTENYSLDVINSK